MIDIQTPLSGFRIWRTLSALLAFTLLPACNEEVDLYTDSQPVPIVWCLLNPGDSIQYLRLGRSYQAGIMNAQVSPPADSTVWEIPRQVYLEEYENGQRGAIRFFEITEPSVSDSGFFPKGSYQLYRSAFRPVAGNTYHLYAYFPDLNRMVSAVTTLNGPPDIYDPVPLSIRKVNFQPDQPYIVRWIAGAHTNVYELVFRMHYRDSSASSLDFHWADYSGGFYFNQTSDQIIEKAMGGMGFFEAMSAGIPVIPGIVRRVISLEFIMVSGGTDLGYLVRTSMETGSNFTNLAEYSNVRNGLGIFSSRSVRRVPNLALSGVTVDELAHGENTRNLGFLDSRGQ